MPSKEIGSIGSIIMKYAKLYRQSHPGVAWKDCVRHGAKEYKRGRR